MKIVVATLLFLLGLLFGMVGFFYLMAAMFIGSIGFALTALVMSVRYKRPFFLECALGVALQLAAFGILAGSASKVGAFTIYLLLTQWVGYAALLVILMAKYRYLLFKVGPRPSFHLFKVLIIVLVASNALILAWLHF